MLRGWRRRRTERRSWASARTFPRRGGAPICIIRGSGARGGLTLNNVLYPTGLYK
jgi:hypothetical protein